MRKAVVVLLLGLVSIVGYVAALLRSPKYVNPAEAEEFDELYDKDID